MTLRKKTRESYVIFSKMLNEVDFRLVSDYIESQEKVCLVYKSDDSIKLNMKPNSFKISTYKAIINFKNTLTVNNDEFVKFVGLSDKNSLIAQIKTFDGGIVEIDMRSYNHFNRSRQDFYNKLKKVGGSTKDYYIDNRSRMVIYIDGVKLNPMDPNTFKQITYESIINFKNNITKNRDRFINFFAINNKNSLIAKIKTFDDGLVDINIGSYNSFNRGRGDFYNKLKEINGFTEDYYIDTDTKMNICIDDVELNPISPDNFKRQTYSSIIKFKNSLNLNNDKFIKFIGLNKGNSLIARIKTFDGGVVEIDIAAYSKWNRGRQTTYNYCKEKEFKVLSPCINNRDKILIDFNCEHKPHWITPNSLKSNQGCPICDESKGEKAIRMYLENNNIEFEQEYKFDDCKYKNSLPFDFYIPSLNLCIEYDGEQHYKANDFFGGEESFKTTKTRDRIKNNYCKDNGINLLRIPYYDSSNVEKILDEEFNRLKEELKEAS